MIEESYSLLNGIHIIRKENKVIVLNPENFRWAVIDEKGLKEILATPRSRVQKHPLVKRLEQDKIFLGTKECSADITENNRKKDLSLVVLHSTDRCSLNCSYCYANANSSNRDMPIQVAIKGIKRVVETEPTHPIKIEFHGGEPTLNLDLIFSATEYASRFYQENGKPLFNYGIQSNGLFFPKELLRLLKEKRFSVGISLDGPEEFHDKYRRKPSKEGSFKEVVETIRELNSRKINFGTICVVTSEEVLKHYPSFMVERGLPFVKFNPYFANQGRARETPNINQGLYAEEMLALADRLVELNRNSRRKYTVGNIATLMRNILSPARDYMCLRFPCGAGISMIGIGIEGEVYPCEEMNGKEELQIGNIYRDPLAKILSHPVNRRIGERKLEDIADCKDCFARNVCEVSCANKSYIQSKDFNSKTSLCDYYKTIVPELLWRIHKNPEIIRWLT